MTTLISTYARRLDEAAVQAHPVAQFTGAEAFDLATAYAIQRASIARRVERGEQQIGVKLGMTSRAKAAQMGVSDVICGRLTDAMHVADGGSIALHHYVHPRAEPEIAFLLKDALPASLTPLQALAAVEAVAPALEIIDSRYVDFRFSLTDVIADNCSSAGFVIGPWQRPTLDIGNLGMIMCFDGRTEALGSSAAILGHPLRSLAAAARLAATYEIEIAGGSIVLAGAATAASALHAGVHVSLEVESLGQVDFTSRE